MTRARRGSRVCARRPGRPGKNATIATCFVYLFQHCIVHSLKLAICVNSPCCSRIRQHGPVSCDDRIKQSPFALPKQ